MSSLRFNRGYEYVFVINEQVLGCLNGTQVRSELRWLSALHKLGFFLLG